MGRKSDLRDVERVARQFNMDPETRREFGDFLEQCKRTGDRGTKNKRGDYTEAELQKKAKEFLGLTDD